MSGLAFVERPPAQPAEGLIVLHHGRGTSERDLIGLADVLDPDRRLHVAAPRGPLTLRGWPGFHWYTVPRVGHPDPDTFHASRDALAAFHDELWARTGLGPERTVLGGFSMGCVMSWALGVDPDRPAPAGILALSGFVPIVDGWEPDFTRATRAFVAHGRQDPVISVEHGRRARALAEAGGMEVSYHEGDGAHAIDPHHLAAAVGWVGVVLA